MNRSYPPAPEQPETAPPQGAGAPIQVRPPALKPIVTFTMIGICIVLYVLQLSSQNMLGTDWLIVWGVKVNQLILQGEIWRFFTPMFLHGSILHIAFNMYALFNIGPTLENFYGHQRFLALYLLGGFAGNVFSFMFSPNPSLGSSTAIFGLLGAEGVFLYQNRDLFGNVARRALTQVVSIAVVNLMIGLSPGIDNWGHIGGLIGGTLFAWFAGPLMSVGGFFPNFSLLDRREMRSVAIAGIGVGALFAFLAVVIMFTRML